MVENVHQRSSHSKRGWRPICASLLILLTTATTLPAQQQTLPDVTTISLEDLMNFKVTSVAKREQKLADAPAAIFVITQEDIRRSGARNVPEALRLAPGIEVARIDENKWAITSRGFNGRFANKLLVLIDGRSVYTPLFSGVYWNVQDVLLEDVERIEVIRGPGATLWGANAVNGVINIITKEAQATQGGLVSVGAGNELKGSVGSRFGGRADNNTYYRVYAKYFDWKSSTDALGNDAFDGWNTVRGGFRIDSTASLDDTLTLQGDLYRGTYGETLTTPSFNIPYSTTFRNDGDFSGGNMLGRWNHVFSHSKTTLQLYFDRTNTGAHSLLGDHQNTVDIDFQHDIRAGESHELIWGFGYRSTQDRINSTPNVILNPDHRNLSLFSAFTQDEFAFFHQRFRMTVGSKFEGNQFTGFEMEPNARMVWTINPKQSVWGAVSRAVRTPARTEEDMRLNAAVIPPSAATGGLPVLASVLGGHEEFRAEDLTAFEGGYRVQATSTFSADIATFYNRYTNLLSAEPQTPYVEFSPLPLHIEAPLVAANKKSGGTYGTEFFAEWKPAQKLKFSGTYSFLKMNIHSDADSLDTTSPDPGGASPQHQFYLRSSIDLPKNFEHDITLRYVGKLSGLAIPSYYSLDGHAGWKPVSMVELAIGGQNLLNKRHLEFRPDFINTTPTQVKRTFYAGLTVRF
jgi:iron complex outermembrane receptor protein